MSSDSCATSKESSEAMEWSSSPVSRTSSTIKKVEVLKKSVEEPTDRMDAALLLSVAAIATKEIHIDCTPLRAENSPKPVELSIPCLPKEGDTPIHSLSPRLSSLVSVSEMDYENEGLNHLDHMSGPKGWNRIRTVSIDSPEEHSRNSPDLFLHENSKSLPIVSPVNSPVSNRMPLRKPTLRALGSHKGKEESSSPASSSSGGIPKRPLKPQGTIHRHALKTILRKKFSWKNYPELEAFLIANREEYLRHSALNYTIQQKQYNNKLTERLLELAADQGYVFDEEAFSFVTVRDRIRCYFKSYVQSAKKRGVVIGYAARKAGLLSDDELQRSAHTAGRIVLPPH
mmetsp:Transcript_29905/g.45875  ORF Transcript_29905/g.45875 Transcript_29905/m.45875 type:complete len:343 (+) Transcript_29905:167-1195(+)|eukprot:CAMPEP_0195301870 /NCGR_PEP_ID=MMETSP0707-20130614/30085_1 /TAXON_ID=33640 /ORGANISM="Asterionellopsis glacialis, Strain CCMP134" /LENGTH=342 /DNA_ID=CAMNT_0040364957 /DNA_START=87 /DNA_END=1115 /DNA_ORIENTATION=-